MVTMKEKIEEFVKNYVKAYGATKHTSTDWEEPLIAFADANDPLFRKLKEVVNANHALPSDLLNNAKTVIAYFIPFTKETTLSNIKGIKASKKWTIAYIETNQLIANVNEALSRMLNTCGFKAATTPPTHNFDERKLTSLWSHKHIAFIAGLGKFGIHRMIITEKGCCGRLGSVITDAKIAPTKRNNKESCLYKTNRTCGLCVKQCVFGALKVNDLDKHKCYAQCLKNAQTYAELGLADVCGKCIANVPCSFTNPSKS
jgi:epoxyqueuosine reductase QueG